MHRKIMSILTAAALVFVSGLDTFAIANEREYDDIVSKSDLIQYKEMPTERQNISVDKIKNIEKIYEVKKDGTTNLIWELEKSGISPFTAGAGPNMPTISGLIDELLYAGVIRDHLFEMYAFFQDGVIPTAKHLKSVKVDDGMFFFNLRGKYYAWVGNPNMSWNAKEHNPIVQKNDLGVGWCALETDKSYEEFDLFYHSGHGFITKPETAVFDLYADLFEVSGQNLYVTELTSTNYFDMMYFCNWESEVYSYPNGQSTWKHTIKFSV